MATSILNAPLASYATPLVVAAVFEQEFSIDWIMELTQMKPSQILAELEEGLQTGTVRQLGPGRYDFVDNAERKRLQAKLTGAQRGDLNKAISELIIRDMPEGGEKNLALARHLLHTQCDAEDCRWLIKASQQLRREYKTELAQECNAKVLADLTGDKSEKADTVFIQAALEFARASDTRLDTAYLDRILHEALKRAEKRKSIASRSLLLMHLAKNKFYQNEIGAAFEHFETGWQLAKEHGDPRLLRSATTFGAFFLYWQGRFREVVQHYEQAVSEVDQYPQGSFPLLADITVSHCYAQIGQVTQGLGMADAIQSLCLERGDYSRASFAAGTMGLIMIDIRHLEEAAFHANQAVEWARMTGNHWVEILWMTTMAELHLLSGDNKAATRCLGDYARHNKKYNVSVAHLPYLLDVLWAVESGRLPKVPGISFEKELNKNLSSTKNIFMRGLASRYKALHVRKQGGSSETVLDMLNKSVILLEESGHQIELSRTRLEMAREYLAQGRQDQARQVMVQASEVLSVFNEDLIPSDLRSLLDTSSSREDRFREILRLGQEVVTIRENRDLVQHILSTVNRITGAERGAIFIKDSTGPGESFGLRASKNLTNEQVSHPDFGSSLGMIERVGDSGLPEIWGGDDDLPSGAPGQAIRSRICVPMRLRGDVVGVLYHDNRLLRSAFKPDDLELLSYIAGQAAFAMDNAQAYEEIKRLNEKLQEEKEYYQEQHLKALHFENIVGRSQAITRLLNQIRQVAGTDTTILILGETGVGKELVASAIHRLSPRKDKAFIRANCSALTETLITSELFGHERGAFTGATSRRLGRFELAHQGSILLDEIGDLPMEVQVRLLRVLQSGEFERVGGTETIRPDFRLIAATNLNLEDAVKAGRFRADLYYRLNVFPIHVPPLRERQEDIPLLAEYFLDIYSKKAGRQFKIPETEMQKLMRYHWPGNVRELENIIERGTILSTSSKFRVPDLTGGYPEGDQDAAGVTLQENERRHILWALETTKWKVRGPGGAAELLDVHPSTLSFRMKKLGIARPSQTAR